MRLARAGARPPSRGCACSGSAPAAAERAASAASKRRRRRTARRSRCSRASPATRPSPGSSSATSHGQDAQTPKLDEKAAADRRRRQGHEVDESKRRSPRAGDHLDLLRRRRRAVDSGDLGQSSQTGSHTQSVGWATRRRARSPSALFVQQTDEPAPAACHPGRPRARACPPAPRRHDRLEVGRARVPAFQREALEPGSPAPAGSVTRRGQVYRQALGYSYCLADAKQKTYADKQEPCSRSVEQHDGKAGNRQAEPPTSCERGNR